MMKQDRKRPVTLEDILRLKRAERPTTEFWTQFDRELRVKQLAALVEKRPWWRTISLVRVVGGIRRFHLPLGAAAVLAVTLWSVREYRDHSVPSRVDVAQERGVSTSPVSAVIHGVPAQPDSVPDRVSLASAVVNYPAGFEAAPAPIPAAVAPESVFPAGGSVVMAVPAADEAKAWVTSSALFSAETFADLSGPDSVPPRQSLSPARGFETRGMSARAKPVEPLAQMKVPSGSRRSNLIASATLAATTPPVNNGERVPRALSDERLYDTVSRVNARGAGVLVKF